MKRRCAALVALVVGGAALGLLTALATVDPPRGAIGTAVIALAFGTAWYGLVRRGVVHVVAFVIGALVVVIAAVMMIRAHPALTLGAVISQAIALAAARYALHVPVRLPGAPRPNDPPG